MQHRVIRETMEVGYSESSNRIGSKNIFFLAKVERNNCVAVGSRVGENGVFRGNMRMGYSGTVHRGTK